MSKRKKVKKSIGKYLFGELEKYPNSKLKNLIIDYINEHYDTEYETDKNIENKTELEYKVIEPSSHIIEDTVVRGSYSVRPDFTKEFIYGFLNGDKKSTDILDDTYIRLLIRRYIISNMKFGADESSITSIKIWGIERDIKSQEISMDVNVEYEDRSIQRQNRKKYDGKRVEEVVIDPLVCINNFNVKIKYGEEGIEKVTIRDSGHTWFNKLPKITYEVIENNN